MRFLQIREGHGLAVIEKEKPNSQISAFTHFQWAIGNVFRRR